MRAKHQPGPRAATHAGGALVALSLVAATGCKQPEPTQDDKLLSVLENYAAIVSANYEDSRTGADGLVEAAETFTASPSQGAINPLKLAFHQAHNPFTFSESFRFYGGPIDAVWGQVNAWRVNPALIDYTSTDPSGGIIVDAETYPTIDGDLLASLNQVESHRDVTTGFPAIEFLIWGEDLYPTSVGGMREFTDYTDDPHAARRTKYLTVATTLLADDLADLAGAWAEDGEYRGEFLAGGPQPGIAKILKGLSTLTELELAHRLLDQGLDWEPGSDAPPDELAPFNDRTLEDLEERMVSMRDVYLGSYQPVEGEPIDGEGLSEMVIAVDPGLDERVLEQIQSIQDDIALIPEPYETAVFETTESKETVDDVRDGLRELDMLWVEVGLALQVDVEHGESGEEDTGESGDTGTDDGGTIFLPSSDMG